MPAERRQGMDHEQHEWSPISTRGKLSWPNHARVGLCAIGTLEHTEWELLEGSFSADQAWRLGVRPFPDYLRFSHRDYGHRVGIFRVLDGRAKASWPPWPRTSRPPSTTRIR